MTGRKRSVIHALVVVLVLGWATLVSRALLSEPESVAPQLQRSSEMSLGGGPLGGNVGTVVGVVANEGLIDTGNSLELIQTCGNGQTLLYNTSTSQWACGNVGAGTVTGVVANEGLVDTSNQLELLQTCSTNQVLAYNTSTSQWGCATVVDSVAAGTGISASTTSGVATVSANLTGGTCSNGQQVGAVSSTGGVTCNNNTPNNYGGTYFQWQEDFLVNGGILGANAVLQQGAISYTLSAGTCVSNNGTTTRPGIMECTTGTTATGRSTWQTSTQAVDFNSGNWKFQWVGGVQAVSTSTDTYSLLAGFSDTTAAINIANGCYFLYDEGNVATGGFNSGNANDWECVCAKSSTRTGYLMNGSVVSDGSFTTVAAPVAAYTAPSTNIYNLQIVMTGETEADFYVNGTKSCEITSNIPGTSTNLTGWEWQILKSAGTTSRYAAVDYLLTSVNLNSARSP